MIVKNYVLYTSNQISLMSLFGAEVIWVVIFFYGEVVGGWEVGGWGGGRLFFPPVTFMRE